jgi:hypothetical protein
LVNGVLFNMLYVKSCSLFAVDPLSSRLPARKYAFSP